MSGAGHTLCERLAARTGAPIVERNELQLLRDGNLFFPAFLRAVHAARHSISVQIFRFQGGRIASEFAAAFAERARSGVRVRVLFDAYGTGQMDRSILSQLLAAGVEVRVYNPIQLRTLHLAFRRSHRKIIAVDGRDAFIGGMNLDDAFADGSGVRRWRENAVHIRGPLAGVVEATVDVVWARVAGEQPKLGRYSTPPLGASHAQVFAAEHNRTTMRDVFLDAITTAQRSIHITSAYLIPETDVSTALVGAARRGVDIQLLTTGTHNNVTLARYASRATYSRLLRAGIRIFEYEPSMLHAKSLVVDGVWCSLGSTNVDAGSLRRNLEANIGTCDPVFVADAERAFATDVMEAREVSFVTWQSRSIAHRLAEALTRPLRSLL